MTKILTSRDWQQLWAEGEQNGQASSQSKGFETINQGKIIDISNTYIYWIELRNGLFIKIHEEEFIDDLVWIRDIPDESLFGLSFFISGKVRIERHGLTDKTDEAVGRYYSECNCDIRETEWWKAGEKFSRIYLKIEPQEFFQSFGEEELEHALAFRKKFGLNPKQYFQSHHKSLTL